MTAVKIANLTKTYGSARALDSLTLDVLSGHVTGILGPNGAGKSTLLKAITGLVKPSSGSIKVLDHKPSWKVNEQVAYLPDRGRWYDFHTVRQAVDYSAIVFPFFNRTRAEQLVEFMGLDYAAGVKTLSKGQEARLQLIMCLARDVEIMLLDEPFSGIDLVSREKIIQGIIDSLSNRQQTIVITTHEIHEAESLFDQVVFMDHGQAVLSGDAETLRQEKGSIESIYRGLFQ